MARVRRTQRIDVLVNIAQRFGLMIGRMLIDWLNERAGYELLWDVLSYSRLVGER